MADDHPRTARKKPVMPDLAANARAVQSPWLTTREAAAYLQHGRRFVLREIHAGRLRAARIGGRGEILTRREWCDAFVETLATPIGLHRRTG